MCSTKHGQIETEGIKAITQVTSKIEETVNSKFKAAEELVQRFKEALFKFLTEVDECLIDTPRCLEVVPSPLKEDDKVVESQSEPLVDDYTFENKVQQDSSSKDGEGLEDLQPPTDPLKKICDDLEKVDNTTRKKFDWLLEGLKKLEEEIRKGKIKGKLRELRGYESI